MRVFTKNKYLYCIAFLLIAGVFLPQITTAALYHNKCGTLCSCGGMVISPCDTLSSCDSSQKTGVCDSCMCQIGTTTYSGSCNWISTECTPSDCCDATCSTASGCGLSRNNGNCAAGETCDASCTCVATAPACVDTDGGEDKLTKGTCTDASGSYTDSCIDATRITEYKCNPAGDACQGVVDTNCPATHSNCVNGACVAATPPPAPTSSSLGPEECAVILDIVFAIDASGSMGDPIDDVKTEATNILTGIESTLADFSPDVQYGVIEFHDYQDGDDWVYQLHQELTNEKGEVQSAIDGISAGDNGNTDWPEAYDRVMYESYTDSNIGYRPNAFKILLMLGDDISHYMARDLSNGGCRTTTADPAYDGYPYYDSLAGISTEEIAEQMAANGIVLINLHSPQSWQCYDYNAIWNGVATLTGGNSYIIGGGVDIKNVIVKAVVKAIFDKDGDGYMTLACPCDLANPPGGLKCYDCDDDPTIDPKTGLPRGYDHSDAEAWDCLIGGLVPCGRLIDNPFTAIDESAPCTLCHLFVLAKKIVDEIVMPYVFLLAVLMIVVGGIMLQTASGDPGRISQGKKLLKTAIIGLAIILVAWLIVDTIITLLTPAGSPFQAWHTIDCPVP